MTARVWLVAICVGLGWGNLCPSYTCDNMLASTTCLAWASEKAFKINSVGCKTGYFCSEVSAASWAEDYSGKGGISVIFPCSLIATETVSSSTEQVGEWAYAPCYTRDPNKYFISGGTVITCSSDSDCLLADNTKTPCICSFRSDGFGICQPDPRNEQIFSGYWEDCGTENKLYSQDAYTYWTLYMDLWHYEQSTLTCMDIFQEKKDLSDAFDAYNAAEAAASAFTLAFLY